MKLIHVLSLKEERRHNLKTFYTHLYPCDSYYCKYGCSTCCFLVSYQQLAK